MADSVYYTGTSGVRRMTAANWEAVGVKGQRTVSWNAGNGWAVPVGDLSAGARKYIEDNAEALDMVVMSEHTRSPQAARPTVIATPLVGYPDTPNRAVNLGVGAATAGGEVAPVEEDGATT